ncbi:hypothetical protein D3C72_1648640 [compost metagenome]
MKDLICTASCSEMPDDEPLYVAYEAVPGVPQPTNPTVSAMATARCKTPLNALIPSSFWSKARKDCVNHLIGCCSGEAVKLEISFV